MGAAGWALPSFTSLGKGESAIGLMDSSLMAKGEPGLSDLSFLISKNYKLPVLLLTDQ